jgi:phospholipid/cholesterol/gamma-HCH transport system substrate-binding protein
MSTKLTRSKIPSSAFKMVVFTAVTVLLIGVLATLIGNISFAERKTYSAVFTDATGVFKGDRVRISGVEVGSVRGLEFYEDGDRKLARIEFTVDEDVPIYRDAQIVLRYENIVGQRYLAIVEQPGNGELMDEGETFPVTQTTPALNLTVLFNGFQPLFRALDPETVNRVSFEIVRAFQGEAVTFRTLMADTASLTNTLADKDAVIGQVVRNLNVVLGTLAERDDELTELIVQFRNLMQGLSKDREVISAALPDLAELLGSSTGMLRGIRPPLASDVRGLEAVMRQVAADREVLDASLKNLPTKLKVLARTGSYGSWFNFYTCGADVELQLLGGQLRLETVGVGANEADTVCGGGDW